MLLTIAYPLLVLLFAAQPLLEQQRTLIYFLYPIGKTIGTYALSKENP